MATRLDVQHVDEALDCILAEAGRAASQILRIDGHSGVGKTTLAKLLAARLSGQVISVDCFIPEEPGSTGSRLDNLDVDALRTKVRTACRVGHRVVAEGVRLDEFLPPGEFHGLSIYLGRYNELSDEARRRKKLGTDVYHEQYAPESRADIVVLIRP